MAKKRDIRKKRQHKFQLDINKSVDNWLHEWIPQLKAQHKFSQYIRDGLTLMFYFAEWGLAVQSVLDLFVQLRNGETDKLFEMFPHLQGRVGQGVSPSSGAGHLDKLDKIESMLEIVLAEKKDGTKYTMQSTIPTTTLPKAAPPKAVVSQAVAASADEISSNFLSAFM
jgi:hypothetical protein